MLEGIEALIALDDYGTVSEAAVRLRLTQSAVSKRIQALQHSLGFRLVEPKGRRIHLTSRAVDFLERARPLVAELRILGAPGGGEVTSHLSLAMGTSIASTWGPAVLRSALQGTPGVEVSIHAERSISVIEGVRLGRYQVGLCTDLLVAKDLIHYSLMDEPIMLAYSGLKPLADQTSPLISVEMSTAAWRAMEPLLRHHHPELLHRKLIFVESFGAVAQMVKAGFGDGLLPLGLAFETGLPPASCQPLEHVHRPVALLTRKTVHQLPGFSRLRDQLAQAINAYFVRASSGSLGRAKTNWAGATEAQRQSDQAA